MTDKPKPLSPSKRGKMVIYVTKEQHESIKQAADNKDQDIGDYVWSLHMRMHPPKKG